MPMHPSSLHGTLAARARKALVCALLLPALAAPLSQARAAVREYGPDYQRLTLNVPDGWQENIQDNSVQLISPDKKSAISIRVCPREGKNAEALVRKATRDLSVSGVHKQDDSTWVFYVTSENVRIRNSLHTLPKAFVVISVGEETKESKAVLATLSAK